MQRFVLSVLGSISSPFFWIGTENSPTKKLLNLSGGNKGLFYYVLCSCLTYYYFSSFVLKQDLHAGFHHTNNNHGQLNGSPRVPYHDMAL